MTTQATRPNILFLLPHDLGDYLHVSGYPSVHSPNLDAFAEEGVRFAKHFSVAPECAASRACLFTGVHTYQNGMVGLASLGWNLNQKYKHMAQHLQNANYDTRLFGFQHEAPQAATTLGYQHHEHSQGCSCQAVTENLMSFFKSDDAHQDQPWFACAGFFDVHRPWNHKTRFTPEQVEVPGYLPDTLETRKDLALYHQAIENMDAHMGMILEALDKAGLSENTLVCFTSDHGIPFPRAKSTMYDPGLHIPLFLRWPARWGGGRVFDCLTSHLDVLPTILEVCGIAVPEDLAGHGFLPLLDGHDYAPREMVTGECYFDVSYDPMHYVRTERYKYIRSFAVTDEDRKDIELRTLTRHESGNWIRLEDWDVLSSRTWHAMPKQHPWPAAEELYDLEKDPLEQHNLAEDPDHASVLQQMRDRLQAVMEQTKAPLLKGHMSAKEACNHGQAVDGLRRRYPNGIPMQQDPAEVDH